MTRVEPHPNDDSTERVLLTASEITDMLAHAREQSTKHYLAIGLMARGGVRRAEVLNIAPADIVESPSGPRVRVRDGKGGKDRETPIPAELESTVAAYAHMSDHLTGPNDTTPLLTCSKRTIGRWVDRVGDAMYEDTHDDGWLSLSPHDLRRSWGTLLAVDEAVDPGLVMMFGGWENWETFREHYLGSYTENQIKDQIGDVPWL